jgi:hypothetical protein
VRARLDTSSLYECHLSVQLVGYFHLSNYHGSVHEMRVSSVDILLGLIPDRGRNFIPLPRAHMDSGTQRGFCPLNKREDFSSRKASSDEAEE